MKKQKLNLIPITTGIMTGPVQNYLEREFPDGLYGIDPKQATASAFIVIGSQRIKSNLKKKYGARLVQMSSHRQTFYMVFDKDKDYSMFLLKFT